MQIPVKITSPDPLQDRLQRPLRETTLAPRHQNRLETALRAKPYTEENIVRIAELPDDEPAALGLRNIGKGTLFDLKRMLLELARGWRAERFGTEPVRSLAPVVSASADALSNGLQELATLFPNLGDE